jgi:phospholipase/carboxylesterase
MHLKNIITAGKPLKEAGKALILIHGRGAGADDILSLAAHLNVTGFALFAPQATNSTWYPHSFLVPAEQNQPWLGSALVLVKDLIQDIKEQGIASENIYLLGFSQGACLALEFTARFATRYGGVVALTGGLIGKNIDRTNYSGDFKGTPVFIGAGNRDPHVPLERINESARILEEMNALVNLQVYEGKPHNVSQEEIDEVNRIFFKTL